MESSTSPLITRLQNYYNEHKDFLPLVVLIPTVIGGIWQTLELMLIGFSTLRFFSVSQLVSDGIVILCFLVIFYLFYIIVIKGLNPGKIFKNYVADPDPFFGLYRSLAMIILIVFYIIRYVVPDMPSNDFYTLPINLSLALIFSYLFFFLVLIGFIIMFLVQVVNKYFFKQVSTREQLDDKLKRVQNYFDNKEKFWSKAYNILQMIISAFMFVTFFVVLSYIIGLRNHVVNSQDIENFRYLKNNKHLSTELQKKYDKSELAYWNDKYVFIKLSNTKWKDKHYEILILKTEDVLFPK